MEIQHDDLILILILVSLPPQAKLKELTAALEDNALGETEVRNGKE